MTNARREADPGAFLGGFKEPLDMVMCDKIGFDRSPFSGKGEREIPST